MRAVLLCLVLSLSAVPALAGQVVLFAAASTRSVMEEIGAAWHAETGHKLVVSAGGSSALARQITVGAPADLFLSASPDWMDVVEVAGLLVPGTRHDLMGNTLVLIAHGDQPPVAWETLPDALAGSRMAMALIDAVPAGQYGKAALQHLGLWDAVAPRVVQTDNVRSALALVSLGEAGFGVVYATDARESPGVTIVAAFPDASHPPILYPVAALSGANTDLARAFLDYLAQPPAQAVLTRHGFVPLP